MERRDTQSGKARRGYTEEFRRDAVRLVTDQGYSFRAAAQAMGVCEQTLRGWHRKFTPAAPPECGEDASLSELQEENKRLRKALERAELEREILKKATAYFAKESQ